MKLAANCKKIFVIDDGQGQRLKQFFPKLKNHINKVPKLPPGLIEVKELDASKYHTKTLDDIIAATKDIYLQGYLGE